MLRAKDGVSDWRPIGIKSNYEFGVVGYWKPEGKELYTTLPESKESIKEKLKELKESGTVDPQDMTLIKISLFASVPVNHGGPGKMAVIIKGLAQVLKRK